jgi:TrmH family RNA methyltransferase
MLTKAQIALIKSLGDKKARTATGLFVAEGAKLVDELLRSELEVQAVYELSPGEMERISRLKTPSSVVALVRIPTRTFDPQTAAENLVLALDEVQDPGNLGTIIRLADWFGIRDLVCSPATADAFNPKVVQATMGAIARVRIHCTPLPEWLDGLAGRGIPVYGTFLDGEPVYDAPLGAAGVLVMGNEGGGISAAVAQRVTRRLFIPPWPRGAPGGESLNVAVATAIVCSEFRRRSSTERTSPET